MGNITKWISKEKLEKDITNWEGKILQDQYLPIGYVRASGSCLATSNDSAIIGHNINHI